jgi:tol-pal system protein YbgF
MRILPVLLAATALAGLAAPVFAQSASELTLRINRLEEQVRQLTGQNEEYQHQIRLLQQQLQQGGAPATGNASAPRPPAGQPSMSQPPGARPPMGGVNPNAQIGAANPNIPAPGPQDLGTMSGTPGAGPNAGPGAGAPGSHMGTEPGAPLVLAPDFQQQQQQHQQGAMPPGPSLDPSLPPGVNGAPQLPPGVGAPPPGVGAPQQNPNQSMATLTPGGTPEEEYALGAGFLQRKDYEFAETQFQNFLKQFPNDARAPDALYGLGESFYQRKQYNDAIEPFLEVVTKHGQSPRAADSMLRLGQTLSQIDQREQACATLLELGNKYPKSTARTQSVKEMQKIGC